jgi:hypothetical protein
MGVRGPKQILFASSKRPATDNRISAILKQSPYFAITLTYSILFLPSLWLFLHGIEPGMNHVDCTYPYPQSREPLYKNPLLIYTHIYANILALGIQISLLYLHPPNISISLHSCLAWAYTFLVILGTSASIVYASRQNYGNDGGRSGFFAFSIMAFVTFYTLCMTLWYGLVKRDKGLHREWALRNSAVLYGNGVLFRILANTFLVRMEGWGADFYACWCQMIYLSWIGPLIIVEGYLSWERENGWEVFVEGLGQAREVNGDTDTATKSVG